MSIANLQDFDVQFNNLVITNDLTIGHDLNVTHNINIGHDADIVGDLHVHGNLIVDNDITASADVNITDDLNVGGQVDFAHNLEVHEDITVDGLITVDRINPAAGQQLIIGDLAGIDSIAIGNGICPIVFHNGIEAAFINVGNTLAPQALKIGGATDNTTRVEIGNSVINTAIVNNFELPSTNASPLIITESYQDSVLDSGFSGALSVPNGACDLKFCRFGNFVTVNIINKFTRTVPTSNALNSITPITLTNILPPEVRPLDNITAACGVFINGVFAAGQLNIFTTGAITYGSLDQNHFTSGQSAGIMDISFSYHV